MSFTTKKINYESEWRDRIDAVVHKALPEGTSVTDRDYREAAYKAYPGYLLFCFCEKYRQQYATHWQALDGFIPAQLHLIEKHHWLPEQAFALDEEQLLLLLHRELTDLRLPQQAYQKLLDDFEYLDVRGVRLNPPEDATRA
ncbi:hypothetical protein PS833_00733 [Pseudomonas fluorescens]|uniref:Uncharacterized protein n=1 Tax=Pseudomonas fluorescens TaxID=294 RepID=A0A5E7AAC5_PSEFL|nr:hypothetical protein PS833_00733 [Pseudomonas fluorescens]